MRPLGPSTSTAVEPSAADPAPTPDVRLPPRLCQPGVTPAVVPANSLKKAALPGPRTNTTPTPGAGVATPMSPLAVPPSDRQPDQWAPSVLRLTNTVPAVLRASTYRVPPTFTAAGPLPASVRPPRLRQGFVPAGVSSLSQTAPSGPRTTASMASPPGTERAPAATLGRDVSFPPRDTHAGVPPVASHSAWSLPWAKMRKPGPIGLGTKPIPGPPVTLPPRDPADDAGVPSGARYTRLSMPV